MEPWQVATFDGRHYRTSQYMPKASRGRIPRAEIERAQEAAKAVGTLHAEEARCLDLAEPSGRRV